MKNHHTVQKQAAGGAPRPLGTRVLIFLSYFFGGVSMVAWLAFLFSGCFNLVDLKLGEAQKLGVDVGLSLIFFIQHSVMLRRSYREWLQRFIPWRFHGLLFSIFSGISLLLVVIFWQESAYALFTPGMAITWLLHGLFIISLLGFYRGIKTLGNFDLFGVGLILLRARGLKLNALPRRLNRQGMYGRVRHPQYLFFLLMIWCSPDFSLDRLVYNVLWTIWIVIGSLLEERDLTEYFGEPYRRYQKNVPMLLPSLKINRGG